MGSPGQVRNASRNHSEKDTVRKRRRIPMQTRDGAQLSTTGISAPADTNLILVDVLVSKVRHALEGVHADQNISNVRLVGLARKPR